MKQGNPAGRRPVWFGLFGAVVVALFGAGMYMALVSSPPDVQQGELIRIMYAHVSVAWIGFVATAMAALFGALYLWRGRRIHDIWAQSSAELALFYTTLTLIGGMTYSKPTFNVFWTWDARLTLTALMFLLLAGYFIVRGIVEDPERKGRVSAVIAIVVAASLPLNYLAAEWFRTLHPPRSINVDGSGVTMAPEMLQALLFNVGVAALAYVFLLLERVRIGRLEAKAQEEAEERAASSPTPEEAIHV